MIKTLDEIIYYPSTRKVITEELRSAIGLYQSHAMTNDQFYFLIDHYVQNFSYLLFSDDYEIHNTIKSTSWKKEHQDAGSYYFRDQKNKRGKSIA